MRNRLLFPSAVLAIALGFAAAAHADIAVTTVIVDPDGTWQVKAKLWGDEGVGSTPASLGFLDFVLYNVEGVDGLTVDSSLNVSPYSYFIDGTTTVPAGFSKLRLDGTGGAGIMAKQNSSYTPPTNWMLDQAVFLGIGVGLAGETQSWNPPAGSSGDGGSRTWDSDTLVSTGSYTGSGGTLQVTTFGRESFSVLPNSGGLYTGPTSDIGPFSWVSAVVTQTMTGGTGNTGGLSYDRPTQVTVEDGTFRMSTDVGAAGVFVSLTINGKPDTGVILAADQGLKSLAVSHAADGLQAVNLNGHAIRLYADNMTQAESALAAAIVNASANPGDGLYDSTLPAGYGVGIMAMTDAMGDHLMVKGIQGLDLNSPPGSGEYRELRIYSSDLGAAELGARDAIGNGDVTDSNLHANSAIGVTDHPIGGGSYVQVRATRLGDADCSGAVNLNDLTALALNWNKQSGATWDMADFTGDQKVDLNDLTALALNWNQNYTPEPCTLILLGLGAVGLLRRKRS